MDIGTNNQISWTSVPTTISIVAGKIITISVDDKKTDQHFAGQSIHGIVNNLSLRSNTPVSNMQALQRLYLIFNKIEILISLYSNF